MHTGYILGLDQSNQQINNENIKENDCDSTLPTKQTDKYKTRTTKNTCSRTASINQISGKSILGSKKRYSDNFEYAVLDNLTIIGFLELQQDKTYYFVSFHEGLHDSGYDPCLFKRIPTRCAFTKKQNELLEEFKRQHSYDVFDSFWDMNWENFTQTKQQVQTKVRSMLADNRPDILLNDFATKYNLNYLHRCDQSTSFQHHFGFCNQKFKEYFNNHAYVMQLDYSFFKLKNRQAIVIHVLSSYAFSKLAIPIAFYIIVKTEEAMFGETDKNTELSVEYFAQQLEFKQLQYCVTDCGKVYETQKLRSVLNNHLKNLNKGEFTGTFSKCGHHKWMHMKPTQLQKKFADNDRNIKYQMQNTYFNWISAPFEEEKDYYYECLENLYADVGLANKPVYGRYLDQMVVEEQQYCIIYRPMTFSGPIAQTTQIGESINHSRLKRLLNEKSGLYDVVVALSCTDQSFKDTIQNHLVHNSGHSEKDCLGGCVLKANETVQQQIWKAKYNYKATEVIVQPNSVIKLQISLNDTVIIPYFYDLKGWQTAIQLSKRLEFIQQLKTPLDTELQQEYKQLLASIRCPCACRVQSELSCVHEACILNHLQAVDNKYLLTSLVRVEYTQKWLHENLPKYFETREFYQLHGNRDKQNLMTSQKINTKNIESFMYIVTEVKNALK
ncbi:Conserved_hypothetical protein [Hexamita inflata]|uniref:SWIM-type domain-containing protein n=1 Tax=Hexamita inflata TaxID=28002 RepID=A0AA86UEH1_9EUKA|nr:Conserved hypothetical protein [Hexamita inflata]